MKGMTGTGGYMNGPALQKRYDLILFTCLLFLAMNSLQGQSLHSELRKGDRSYLSKNYPEAATHYQQALEKAPSYQGAFNLGNSLYQQEKYDEAVEQYQNALRSTPDQQALSDAWYNTGNAFFQKKDYQKSVEAYKEALRINPEDWQAKQNLALAKRMVPPPQNGGEQNQNQKQNQNQNQDQKQGQDQKQKQNQEQKQPQDQQQYQDDPKQQPEKPKPSPGKKEAEQMLQIMKEEERKTQERLRNNKGKSTLSVEKDW
jgi:Ca-activated chloride channel family protein